MASVAAAVTLFKKVPLAPLAGAANVTVAALIGLLPASLTTTESGVEKLVLMTVLCGEPLVTAIDAGGPG